MGVFQSKKRVEGFSACFRQWKAEDTHCKFLHGYGIYFDLVFEGELDYRNWVMDFGFVKRSKNSVKLDGVAEMTVDQWFKYMFDHTTVVAKNDPELDALKELHDIGVIQLRVLDNVGCEMFAKYVHGILSEFLFHETENRVRLMSVECFEHERNSAIYKLTV